MLSFIKIRGAVLKKNDHKILILCNFNKDIISFPNEILTINQYFLKMMKNSKYLHWTIESFDELYIMKMALPKAFLVKQSTFI